MLSDIQRGQVHVSSRHWHYRLYEWYNDKQGNMYYPWYRENLCHYMRIVCIWAPLYWLFLNPIYGWIRPYMVEGVIGGIALLWWGLSTSPETVWMFLQMLGLVVGVIAIIIGCVLGLMWLTENHSETIGGIFKYLTYPIWFPMVFVVGKPQEEVHGYHRDIDPVDWFFGRRRFGVIYPWTIFFVECAILALVLGVQPDYVLYGLLAASIGPLILWYGVQLVGIIVGVTFNLVILGGHAVLEPVGRGIASLPRPQIRRQPSTRGTSTWAIIWHFLRAWKAKICPFIILPHQWENQEPAS